MQMAQPLRIGVSEWMRGINYTPAAGTSQIALSTTDPTYNIAALAEPVGAGYSRQNATFGAISTIGNVRASSNTAAAVFTATGNWGTITHGVLFSGNIAMWQGNLNAQKLVNNGNSLSFATGALQITTGASWSNYSRDLILNVQRGSILPAPTGLFLALSTADITATGGGIAEPVGTYARQAIAFTETSNTAAGIIVGNNASAVFGPATANWGNISHMGIYDAVTGGNLIAYGSVAVQKNIIVGDAYAVSINSLALTIR